MTAAQIAPHEIACHRTQTAAAVIAASASVIQSEVSSEAPYLSATIPAAMAKTTGTSGATEMTGLQEAPVALALIEPEGDLSTLSMFAFCF